MNKLLKDILFGIIVLVLQVLFIFYFSPTLTYTPYIYLLILFLVEQYIPRIGLLFFAFGLGLVIDFFTNSWGVHTASAVLIAFIIPAFSSLFSQQSISERINFSEEAMGTVRYAVAVFALFFVYHFTIELLWNFSLRLLPTQLLKALICTVIASVISAFLHSIFKTNSVVEDE